MGAIADSLRTGKTVSPPRPTPHSTRLADVIERGGECCAIALLLGATAIALLHVFYRYILGDALPWPEEAVKFMFAWFVFIGAAMVTRRTEHITVDALP